MFMVCKRHTGQLWGLCAISGFPADDRNHQRKNCETRRPVAKPGMTADPTNLGGEPKVLSSHLSTLVKKPPEKPSSLLAAEWSLSTDLLL